MIDKNYTPKDLGSRLKELIKENNLTQIQFSEKIEFSRPYISCMIGGKRSLSIETLDKICKALNTTPDYLIYGIKPYNP